MSSNQLQAISSIQDSCKDQSQAVSEAFTQNSSHTLQRQRLAASLLLPARTYVRDVITAINEQWRSMGRQKRSEFHYQGEFLHNCTFESVYNGDHNGVVRIFVGLFLRAVRFDYLFNYIMWNFSPTRSVITLRRTIFFYQECNSSALSKTN